VEDEEDDDDEEDEEDDEDDEDDSSSEGPCNGRYYTKYYDYISPSGKRYKKHDAAVPHKHLIEYVKCMNYQKFEGKHVVIELDKERKSAKITRYRKKYVKMSKHYLDDETIFYDKIYTLLCSAQPDNAKTSVTCYRPSYMYTSDFLIGNECCYESEDLEDEKYSGPGVEEISYDGHSFRP